MDNSDFDVRSFYRKHEKDEESSFTNRTGLSIRKEFQPWYEGGNCDELFALKTNSGKECIGICYGGMISYLLPVDYHSAIILLFDANFISITKELIQWPDAQLELFAKHVPSLMTGFNNGYNGCFDDYSIFVDEEMVCFGKKINNFVIDEISNGDYFSSVVIPSILDVLDYRLKCSEELDSFNGFSQSEINKIKLKEGFSVIRKGLRYVRLVNFISMIN